MANPELQDEQSDSTERSWHFALLTAAEPGRRNRRTIDGVLVAMASLLVGSAAVIARSAPEIDEEIGRALTTVLGWAPAVWHTAFLGALALAFAIVVDVVVRQRWKLARDVLLALSGVAVLASVLSRIVDSNWSPAEAHVFSNWGFPELRLACIVAVVVVAGPELVRPALLLAIWLVGLATLGAVALEAGLPSQVLAGLALGLSVGSLVRLALGSPAGIPPTKRVQAALRALGVDVADLKISERQRVGSAEYLGHGPDGSPLRVRVLGRDAQDTQRLARRWRLLAYRDPPRSAPIGRLEQVEHEAVATLMAAQAGVRVPGVLTAGLGPDGDAVIVTRQPDLEPLELSTPDRVSDETLTDLWQAVARLHKAGISHGRLNASNVVVDAEGPMLVDLSAATLAAPQSALDIDVAELLVASTILVGPERALQKAVDGDCHDAVARALPYLQPAALTPHLRDLARSNEVELKNLRTAAAAATGTEVPEIVPLRRVRPRDVLVMVAVAVAAYLLISQLAEIGFGTIVDELSAADIPWVVVALVLAQLTYIPQGVSLRGAVLTPLALLPCVVLQSAVKFINLTVPGSAGAIAMNVRFLQRMGAPTGEAVAAGAISGVSQTVIELLLIVLLLAFVDVQIDSDELKLEAPSGALVAAIVIAVVVTIAVVLLVPKVRAKVVPQVREGLASLWAVARTRRKRLELFGGNIATEVVFALTLGAACHAYGVDLSLAQLLLVNMAASSLASVLPVPGGIGAAEAALTAGFVAMGVDESTGFAIALTHRLCTYYLPPILGYFSLSWLRRKGYL